MPRRYHIIGHNILSIPSNPRGQKRAPSISLEQEGKKPYLDIDSVLGEDKNSSESNFKGVFIPLGVAAQGQASLIPGGNGSTIPVDQR